MPEVIAAFDAAFGRRTRDEWGRVFDEHGLIWGPVLSLDEVAADPQAEAIGLFPQIDHPELGAYRTVRIPARFGEADVGPRGPSPRLGEHTRSVLDGIGFTVDEIERMVEIGAVATGS